MIFLRYFKKMLGNNFLQNFAKKQKCNWHYSYRMLSYWGTLKYSREWSSFRKSNLVGGTYNRFLHITSENFGGQCYLLNMRVQLISTRILYTSAFIFSSQNYLRKQYSFFMLTIELHLINRKRYRNPPAVILSGWNLICSIFPTHLSQDYGKKNYLKMNQREITRFWWDLYRKMCGNLFGKNILNAIYFNRTSLINF